jgi:beclin 1
VLVPIKKDSPKAPGANQAGGSSGTEVGGSLLGWASKLIAFSVEATGMDHPLSPSAFKRGFKNAEQELVHAKAEQKAYRALLAQLEQDAKEWRTQEALAASGGKSAVEERGLYCEEEVKIFNDRSKSNNDLRDEMVALEQELLDAQALMLEEKRRRKVLQVKQRDLDQLRQKAWLEVQSLQLQLDSLEDQHSSLKIRKEQKSKVLRRLNSCSACNDAFHIWHRGAFATINGFRLGRLPTEQVGWTEINAALGQSAMLLCTIAEKASFTFATHRIMPMGSFSKIVKVRCVALLRSPAA